MARPKDPIEKSVQFHARITPGEGAVLEELVKRWAAEMAAQSVPVSADRTVWFRGLLRREAGRYGLTITEPPQLTPPAPDPAPRTTRRK